MVLEFTKSENEDYINPFEIVKGFSAQELIDIDEKSLVEMVQGKHL